MITKEILHFPRDICFCSILQHQIFKKNKASSFAQKWNRVPYDKDGSIRFWRTFTFQVSQNIATGRLQFTSRMLKCYTSRFYRLFWACSTWIVMNCNSYPIFEGSNYRHILKEDCYLYPRNATCSIIQSNTVVETILHLHSKNISSIVWHNLFFKNGWHIMLEKVSP